MAKPKSDPSKEAKHLADVRQKFEVAQKAHTDKPTGKTEADLKTAKEAVTAAIAADNRERFVRVGGGRVRKARAAIANMAGVAQPRSYSYDSGDCDKAEAALNDAVKKAIGKMRSALEKGNVVSKATDDFGF